MQRLPRRAVRRHLDRLADDLTPRQLSRLQALADLIGEDGQIPLPRALEVATPGGDDTKAQDAFRKFRAALDHAARDASVDVRLVSDQRKAPPQERFCWFEGADVTGEEVAELSSREAARLTADAPVRPFATEVMHPVVYVETARNASEALRRREREFVALLTEQLSAVPGYRVISALDIRLGVDLQAERRQLRETAEVVVELDSAAARRDEHPGATIRRPIRVALEGVARGAEPTGNVVHGAGQPFSQCPHRSARLRFIGDVLDLIDDRLREALIPALPPLPDSEALARRLADRRALDVEPVPPRAGETSLASDALSGPGPRRLGTTVPAVQRLLEWATDSSATARHLCALLGDVGMGKTTTITLFTRELLDLRARDQSAPLPILFDLRDLPPAVVRAGAGLPAILTALLEQLGTGPSAEQVLDLVAGGNCVLIFDGLDEVLVHLDPHAGQVFTRTLWRATEDTWRSRPAERKPARPSKLLLSCRTHYFRTIRHEATHFTGQHRDGPATADYLALLMLPFDEEQVRAYLIANLPGADVERLLELIDSVHNLREIAERPLTLRMVSEQLETLERAKLAGRTVRAVDLYGSFVSQWLERDDGKHCLLPEHKELLMEHLAAELWRSGRTEWGVGDVEQWLLEFLNSRPDLELHYPARAPDLWKEDLRTATFLVRRDDDSFGFAHTSLREYFLARYLGRALELPPEQVRARWQLPVPSPETLEFLGQWLAGHDAATRTRDTAALATLAAHIPDGRADATAVLAFAYCLAAARGGHPSHHLAGSHLPGVKLTGWQIDGGDRRLDLRDLSLTGANLTDAVLRDVDLSGADLSGADLARAELHDIDLSGADLRRANLTGTVFRHCDLTGARWTGSTAYQTQALRCRPTQDSQRQGWLVAPTSAARPSAAVLSAFTGHTSIMTWGGWSPDGTRLLTTSHDGTARVWDAATGQLQLTLTGHTHRVTSGAWSPDGTRLLTTSDDGTARVWDAATGQLQLTLTGHTNTVSGGWSPDGTRLLTTSDDGTARVWDAATGQLQLTLTGHTNTVSGGWSPDGTRLLTTSHDGTARVWDAATGQLQIILTGHTRAVTGGGWSPDGTRLLTTSGDRTARVWDAVIGRLRLTLTGHTGGVSGGGWSPDGTRLLTTSYDGTARVWDAGAGQLQVTLTGHTGWVIGGGWSPDGTRLLITSDDGTARVWDAGTGQLQLTLTLTGGTFRVSGGGWSPDGARLFTTSDDGTARVWDTASGQLQLTLTGHTFRVSGGGWSPDGARLFTTNEDGTARVWDAGTGRLQLTLTGHAAAVTGGRWSPDGTRLLTTSRDNSGRVWDAGTGRLQLTLTGQTHWLSGGGWSPDGTRLLTTSGDNTAWVWDAATGQRQLTLTGHTRRVSGGDWSPDGTRLLTTSDDGSARVWDAATGQLQLTLTGHTHWVSGGGWSPDGTRLLTTSYDGSGRVWDAGTGQLQLTLTGHTGWLSGGGWSPDGTRLLTTSHDRTARIWDSTTGQLVGWQLEQLPDGELAVWSSPEHELLGASDGAWRWLGWLVPQDGRLVRLPAETWGPLPPLNPPEPPRV